MVKIFYILDIWLFNSILNKERETEIFYNTIIKSIIELEKRISYLYIWQWKYKSLNFCIITLYNRYI